MRGHALEGRGGSYPPGESHWPVRIRAPATRAQSHGDLLGSYSSGGGSIPPRATQGLKANTKRRKALLRRATGPRARRMSATASGAVYPIIRRASAITSPDRL